MAQRTVLHGVYTWMTPAKGRPGRYDHNVASRGDVIEVSAEEAKRGEGLGFLGSAADFEEILAKEAEAKALAEAGAWGGASDEEIEAMNVAELVAYINQVPEEHHDDEILRVVELEELRDKPRKAILGLGEPATPAE